MSEDLVLPSGTWTAEDSRWLRAGDEALAAPALSGGVDGPAALRPLLDTVLAALADGSERRAGPLPACSPGELADLVRDAFAPPAERRPDAPARSADEGGDGDPDALRTLTELLAYGSADPADPTCAAHLHCPPVAVAVAADLAVSALNPSQDSWDQAPAATVLETLLVDELAGLVGYDTASARGVLTSGGTESNLMGLMLARDHVLARATGHTTELYGLPRGGPRPRVLTSQAAHFSVQRSAALLGLGEDAVLAVPVDGQLRMDPEALARALDGCARRGDLPLAVVATAGTTDTGAVDPLRRTAELAASHGAWLHVDAAYGGGALLSARLAPLLDGIALADSVSLDWHKLGWAPVAAGVFLVRRAETYASLQRRAAYLNPADDEEAGYPSLLGRSLRTTRRADAFKIAVTLRTLGREGLGRMVDTCHGLARYAADAIRAHPRLELHTEPVLSTVVFRYVPRDQGPDRGPAGHGEPASPERSDALNAGLRRRLLREGRAVVGRTSLPQIPDAHGDMSHRPKRAPGDREGGAGRVRLKLTLLNPRTRPADVDRLLLAVVAAGEAEESAGSAGAAGGEW